MGKWAKIGNVIKAKDGGRYFKFADNVTVLKDGEELDLNASRTGAIEMKEGDIIVLGQILSKDTKIAEIRKGKDGKKNYLRFDKTITFKVDAAPFKANKNNAAQLQDPTESLEKLIKRGFVKESDVEKRREKVKEVSTWLEYEVTLPDDSPMKN